MTPQDWALIVTTLVAISTAVWAGVKTFSDKKSGAASTENTTRRDTIADRDAWIQTVTERNSALDKEISELKKRNTALADYIDLLRQHIFKGSPPPPPERP